PLLISALRNPPPRERILLSLRIIPPRKWHRRSAAQRKRCRMSTWSHSLVLQSDQLTEQSLVLIRNSDALINKCRALRAKLVVLRKIQQDHKARLRVSATRNSR